MAQLVAILVERRLVEVHLDDQGAQAYRLTEEGVRVGNTLAMVEGEDAEAVTAFLRTSTAPRATYSTRPAASSLKRKVSSFRTLMMLPEAPWTT